MRWSRDVVVLYALCATAAILSMVFGRYDLAVVAVLAALFDLHVLIVWFLAVG